MKHNSSKNKKLTHVLLYVKIGLNNTIITAADRNGDVLFSKSGGSCSFKGSKKSTPFAAQVIMQAILEKLIKLSTKTVDVILNGTGPARDHAIRAIPSTGIDITSIKDVTSIPHNGCRPPKRRRT